LTAWWSGSQDHQPDLPDAQRTGVLVRVSALTFTTLISLIPMLAFVFSLLSAFKVSQQVKEYLLMNLTLGRSDLAQAMLSSVKTPILQPRINRLLCHLLGFVVTLASLETTINDIWGIRDRRPLVFRMSYYTTITVLFRSDPGLHRRDHGAGKRRHPQGALTPCLVYELFRGFMRFLP